MYTSAAGLFFFYIVHDALQEKAFRIEGFKFGWFMTSFEVALMTICAAFVEGASWTKAPRREARANLVVIAVLIALSHGLGNTALQYCSFPLKVAFKSSKLIPTMVLGLLITGSRYTVVHYFAATLLCTGLFLLTVADVGSGATHGLLGPALLALATFFDSVVPNVQERILRILEMPTVDMIFHSNWISLLILFMVMAASGELRNAIHFCSEHPEILTILVCQACAAYGGLRCYLAVIKDYGAVGGVILANIRKVITTCLSFILFSKPFSAQHAGGLFLVACGLFTLSREKMSKPKKGAVLPHMAHK